MGTDREREDGGLRCVRYATLELYLIEDIFRSLCSGVFSKWPGAGEVVAPIPISWGARESGPRVARREAGPGVHSMRDATRATGGPYGDKKGAAERPAPVVQASIRACKACHRCFLSCPCGCAGRHRGSDGQAARIGEKPVPLLPTDRCARQRMSARRDKHHRTCHWPRSAFFTRLADRGRSSLCQLPKSIPSIEQPSRDHLRLDLGRTLEN
jgi:hypothetical protein